LRAKAFVEARLDARLPSSQASAQAAPVLSATAESQSRCPARKLILWKTVTTLAQAPEPNRCGRLLRTWRKRRGLSQLELAVRAETTSRYVSFVETGRSRPRREWILRVAKSLGMPLAERNAWLDSVGLRAEFEQQDLHGEALRPISDALHRVVETHMPFPAAALDGRDHVLSSNAAYRTLFAEAADLDPEAGLEFFYRSFGPRRVENWSEVAGALVDRARNLALESGCPELLARAERVAHWASDLPESPSPAAPTLQLRLRVEGATLALVAASMRFEHVRELTTSALRIELLFPADPGSAAYFQQRFAV